MEKHQRTFDKGLDDLKTRLVHMAELAETMIDNTIAALVQRDEKISAKVPDHEEEINRLQIDIDEHALMLLATQQPVANDLRFLVMATRINGELERIGDLAINIRQNSEVLLEQPALKPLIDIPRMAEAASKMVRQSLQAFVEGNVARAQNVIMMDDQVDALKDQLLRELLTYMMSDPTTIERSLALILISRHLERIGDHATNIAQEVIYMVQGRDVRHPRIRHDEGSEMMNAE
jgi:phosphate transport system protein